MCLLMRMCLRRKSVKGLLFALLINSVDRDFKHRVFSAQLLAGVIIRESNFHTDLISRVAADELLFEIIDISAGADDEIRAVSIRAAAVKFDAVHCAHIVDIYGIAVLDSESGIGRKFGIVRGFAFCAFCFCLRRLLFRALYGVEDYGEDQRRDSRARNKVFQKDLHFPDPFPLLAFSGTLLLRQLFVLFFSFPFADIVSGLPGNSRTRFGNPGQLL